MHETALLITFVKGLHGHIFYFIDKMATKGNRKSSHQPMCSWNEFRQTANLTRIENVSDIRWSVEKIGDWQSLCRNLNVNEGAMNSIMNERYKEQHKKDDCLQSYINSDKAYWEEVVIAVARPPFRDKILAKMIAEKHLEHSPSKDKIMAMIESCDTFY